MIEYLTTYLHQVAQTLSQLPHQPLDRIAEAIWETYERDGTILICGRCRARLAGPLAPYTPT